MTDVDENASWDSLMIIAVPLMKYMRKGPDGLQMIRDGIHYENKGVVVPVQVQWLASPHSI